MLKLTGPEKTSFINRTYSIKTNYALIQYSFRLYFGCFTKNFKFIMFIILIHIIPKDAKANHHTVSPNFSLCQILFLSLTHVL